MQCLPRLYSDVVLKHFQLVWRSTLCYESTLLWPSVFICRSLTLIVIHLTGIIVLLRTCVLAIRLYLNFELSWVYAGQFIYVFSRVLCPVKIKNTVGHLAFCWAKVRSKYRLKSESKVISLSESLRPKFFHSRKFNKPN